MESKEKEGIEQKLINYQEQADYGRLDMDIEMLYKALCHNNYEQSYGFERDEKEEYGLDQIVNVMIAKAWYLFYRNNTR